MKFKEIEHKFLVDDQFDLDNFRRLITEKLTLVDSYKVEVVDTYYLLKGVKNFIYRHRYDSRSQQLTVKTFNCDNEDRTEVNLNLCQDLGNQSEAVAAFLNTLSVEWSGTIVKDVQVFYTDDCEIVYYSAKNSNQTIRCVEFEARNVSDKRQALNVLNHYEQLMGFNPDHRCHKTIFQLFFS